MSLKGVQNGVKDGGAHVTTHENQIDSDYLVSESLFVNGISFNPQNTQIVAPARIFQNGGENETSECAVDELLSDCDDAFSISDNNIVWLKSQCKTSSSVGVDLDSVVKENDGECDGNGELFPGEMSGVEDGCGVGEANIGIKTEKHGGEFIKTDTSTSMGSDDYRNQGVTVHFGDFPPDSKEHQAVFGVIQNFCAKSDSVTLMTPQELESLPNRGLEFEDSLTSIAYSSPNYGSDPANIKTENTSMTESRTIKISELDSDEEDMEDEDESSEDEDDSQQTLSVKNSESADSKSLLLEDASQTKVLNINDAQLKSESGLDTPIDPSKLALATISISTDKVANSTQILVNTNQGQQLYLINTADLTQATNALQPLARPTPAQSTSSTTEVFSPAPPVTVLPPTGSSSAEISDQQPQIQPVPLEIQSTGYFLLPVGQQDGSNGILFTTPLTAVSPETRKVWVCQEDGCDKAFRKLSKLKIHQMRHTGERPFKCSRPGCDWAFTTAYKLKRHEESHEGRKDYNCDFPGCGRKFTTVYNLNSHRKLHERPLTEMCPEQGCRQSFPTKRQLDLHIRTHTGLEKTYKCPVSGCDKVFFSPNCMGSHTRVHLVDRQDLVCKFEGCGKVFDKQCRLKQHERRHTGEKPYVCQFQGCTWAFTTASKLKRHKAKHTGLRKWQCTICNKGFMRAEHLKGHMVTHSGVKPFICPVEGCKARFTAKSSLYVHLKKHDASGKKITYHCPMEGCLRNYSSKAGLRNHILKHYLSTPAGGEQATALDWVPLLGGDEEGSLETMVQATTDIAEAAAVVASQTPGGYVIPAASPSDKAALVAVATGATSPGSDGEFITADGESLSAEQLSSSIVSQLIANNPLQPTASVVNATGTSSATSSGKQPTIAIASDGQGTVALENSSGSARTDFRSNHMLSERYRRRWRRGKTGASPHDDDGDDDEHSDVLDTPLADSTQQKLDDASPLFSSDILNTSQGVMFKDPETGITYVQTQLLQDDPPHPAAMYDENGSDTSVGGTVSFTGTTINLQDLK